MKRGCVCALLLLTGCKFFGGSMGPPSPSREFLVAYADRISTGTRRLQELSRNAAAIPDSIRRAILDAGRGFQKELVAYRDVIARLEKEWNTCTAARVEEALERCAAIRSNLKDMSEALVLAVESAREAYEVARQSAEGPQYPGTAHGFLAACRTVTKLTSTVDSYLADVHSRGLSPTAAGSRPAAGVFHFVGMYQLQSERTQSHAWRYEVSWKRWIEIEIERPRLDVAMGVFALACTLTSEYRPSSLQLLFEISNACLDASIDLETLDRIQDSFRRIEFVYSSEHASQGDQSRAIERAKANLLLARARLVDDPSEGADLAGRALTMNPYLRDHVVEYLIRAAEESANSRADTRDYFEAIEAFEHTLQLGPVPDAGRRVAAYRQKLIGRAVRDALRETEAQRFASARLILSRAMRIATDFDDKMKLSDAFYRYYHAYADFLFPRDVERAIAVCGEILDVFPNDEDARKKIDRGLFTLLRRQIGDVDTTFERLGAERILELVKSTVKRMHETDGADMCQRLLKQIEDSWRKQLDKTRDPEAAYHLAKGLARLSHHKGLSARERGAEAIWGRLARAIERSDWDVVERCIDVYFAQCPDVERPETFKDAHVRLLDHYDAEDDEQKLGRHLAIFARAYPADWERVRSIVVRRMKARTSESDGFYALLRSIEPEAPEVHDYERAKEPESGAPVEVAVNPFIDDGELQNTENWWTEPETTSSSRATPVADPGSIIEWWTEHHFGTFSIASGVVGGFGTAVFAVLLPLLTLRKRILKFRWYAAGALWFGLTIGLVVGGMTPEPAGRSSQGTVGAAASEGGD